MGGGRNKQISENEEEIRVFYCLALTNEEEIRRRKGKKLEILAKIFTSVEEMVTFEEEVYMDHDGHAGFDIVVVTFLTFILFMVAFHCYLKRKERQKIEMYLNLD